MLVISDRWIYRLLSQKSILILSSRVYDCVSVTTSKDKNWLHTSSKLERNTTRFWMPKSIICYRKLQTNYFLTKHFWPQHHLISKAGFCLSRACIEMNIWQDYLTLKHNIFAWFNDKGTLVERIRPKQSFLFTFSVVILQNHQYIKNISDLIRFQISA